MSLLAIIVLAAGVQADPYQGAIPPGLPRAVRAFILIRPSFNHWECEEPYDDDRSVEIQSALEKGRCATIKEAAGWLAKRYSGNRHVLDALKATEDLTW